MVVGPDRTVRQFDVHHNFFPREQKKCGLAALSADAVPATLSM
jgi:hypothetical protein